jgi:hypothetical protein
MVITGDGSINPSRCAGSVPHIHRRRGTVVADSVEAHRLVHRTTENGDTLGLTRVLPVVGENRDGPSHAPPDDITNWLPVPRPRRLDRPTRGTAVFDACVPDLFGGHPPAASHAQSSRAARKSLTRPPDNQCAITRNPGLARLETQPLLNHARQHRWRVQPTVPCTYSILTCTNKGGNRDAHTRNGYPRPLPQRTRPGPTDRV